MNAPPDVKTPEPLARSGVGANQSNLQTDYIGPGRQSQRLPAFGRLLCEAIRTGLRPRKLGGSIVVTTEWAYATAAAPGRVVCPPDRAADDWDFGFLAGCSVIVLVPAERECLGAELVEAIRTAGASLVVLSVVREAER